MPFPTDSARSARPRTMDGSAPPSSSLRSAGEEHSCAPGARLEIGAAPRLNFTTEGTSEVLIGERGMRESWEQVAVWRNRAADLRRLAERFAVPSAQDTLRQTAAYYERLASELEERLRNTADGREAGT
jgi:hypothetical protein